MVALNKLIKEKFVFLLYFICVCTFIQAQSAQIDKPKFKRHYYIKKSVYEALPNTNDEILFVGNSITAGGKWAELFNDLRIKNRGISGDVTEGILFRLDEITESKPLKIFLMIGVNDLSYGLSVDSVLQNYKRILENILKDSPNTKIYVQSVLPVNDNFDYFKNHTNKGELILELNRKIKLLAEKFNLVYIDLFSFFVNEQGKLKEECTFDGLHLNGQGYLLWKSTIEKYIH